MYTYNPKSVLGPIGAATSGQIIDNVDITVTAGAAFVAGDVVMIPVPTTIATPGDTSTVVGVTLTTASAVAATAAAGDMRDSGGRRIFGVVLAAAASGATVNIRVKGVVAANLTSNAGAGIHKVPGAKVLADPAVHGTAAKNILVVAYSLETGTGVKYVYFDGVNGLGTVGTA